MVQAARRNDRVVQVGLHRRSSRVYALLAEVVKSGEIGKVTVARAYHTSNMSPDGIGNVPDSAPPEGLDWDMWLGPRPKRPFNPNLMPYKFRWWHLYSSQMANWGVHYFDVMRWMVGETAPASLSAHGGVFAVKDSRTILRTYGRGHLRRHASGMLMTASASTRAPCPGRSGQGEVEIRGTLGTVVVGPTGFQISSRSACGQFQNPLRPKRKPRRTSRRATPRPASPSSTPRRSSSIASSRASGRTPTSRRATARPPSPSWRTSPWRPRVPHLDWDAEAERFTNNERANGLLDYEYRKPWTHA